MAKRRRKRTPGTGGTTKDGPTYTARYPKVGGGYHVRRGFDTRAAAEAWLDSLVARQEQKQDIGSGQQTLAAWLDRWVALMEREREWKAKTAADRRFRLGYVKAHLGRLALADITRDHVDDMILALAADLAPTSVRQIQNLLWEVLDEAQQRRYITYNPVARQKRRKAPQKRAPYRLSIPEGRRLLSAAAPRPEAPAWWLLLCLGLRSGEVCGLRRGDLDLEAATIRIAQESTQLEGRQHFDTPKGGKIRLLPIPRALADRLRIYLDELTARAAKAAARGTWQEHGLVFPGRSGRPRTPNGMLQILRDLLPVAKLPPITVHHLRHTAGQWYTDAGCPEDVRAAMFGHGAATITRHYSPPSLSTQRRWAEAVYDRLVDTALDVRMSV